MPAGAHVYSMTIHCVSEKDPVNICSLDFTVNRVFMKLFRTGNIEVVCDCQVFFNFDLPSMLLRKRTNKFIGNYRNSGNDLCKFLCTS